MLNQKTDEYNNDPITDKKAGKAMVCAAEVVGGTSAGLSGVGAFNAFKEGEILEGITEIIKSLFEGHEVVELHEEADKKLKEGPTDKPLSN